MRGGATAAAATATRPLEAVPHLLCLIAGSKVRPPERRILARANSAEKFRFVCGLGKKRLLVLGRCDGNGKIVCEGGRGGVVIGAADGEGGKKESDDDDDDETRGWPRSGRG